MRDRFRFDPATVAVAESEPLPEACGAAGRAFHVEIGFGKDVRILREAERDPEARFLGVEISRKKSVKFCQKVARAGLANVRCYWGDARKVVGELLPAASVDSFTILFPDPWPKRRHWKNRWIQDDTARLLERALKPGGYVVAATDHDHYRDQIRRCLLGAGLTLEQESGDIPADDRTLFAARFERLGEDVTYFRFAK